MDIFYFSLKSRSVAGEQQSGCLQKERMGIASDIMASQISLKSQNRLTYDILSKSRGQGCKEGSLHFIVPFSPYHKFGLRDVFSVGSID